MIRIDYDDAEKQFDELIERAHHGERFLVVRDGRAVAQIVGPLKADERLPSPSDEHDLKA